MSTPRLRRAGASWRLLVHEPRGLSHGVSPKAKADSEHYRHHRIEGTEFDELVVGRFLHIEQQDTGLWWMSIAGVVVHVSADRDGRPTRVSVAGPGDYDGALEGVEYELVWSRDTGAKEGPHVEP
jgi:hypothetical protein